MRIVCFLKVLISLRNGKAPGGLLAAQVRSVGDEVKLDIRVPLFDDDEASPVSRPMMV